MKIEEAMKIVRTPGWGAISPVDGEIIVALVGEVERLQAEYQKVNALNDSIAASVRHETAKRCAEIAYNKSSVKCEYCDDIVKAIRKEFNL